MDFSQSEKQQNLASNSDEHEHNPYLLTHKASMFSPYEAKEEEKQKPKPKPDAKNGPKKMLKNTIENLKSIFGL